MTFSITPSSPQQFNADPALIIYCEEKNLEHLSYELKKDVADDEPGLAFKRSIDNKVSQIRKTLNNMFSSNCYPHELRAAAKQGMSELNAIHADFCSSVSASREKQEKFHQDILTIQEKVHSTTFAREDFTPPTSSLNQLTFSQFVAPSTRGGFGLTGGFKVENQLKKIDKSPPPPLNSYQDEMISDVKGAIGSVRWIGAGLERVGQAIVGGAKAICKAPLPNDFGGFESAIFNPESTLPPITGEKFCRSTLNVSSAAAKAVLGKTHLKEPLKQAVQYWKSLDGTTVTTALIAHGIPEKESSELAREYVSDLKSIGLAVLPASTFKGPLNLLRYTYQTSAAFCNHVSLTSELFYSLPKYTFVNPRHSLTFSNSKSLLNLGKDEAGTLRITRPPQVLLSEAEEIAARQLRHQMDKGYELAASKRINAERVKLFKDRETAYKVAEVLYKENQKLGLIGLGGRVAQKQMSFRAAQVDKSILKNLQPIILPKSFPKNMNEFYQNSKSTGNITYKIIGDDALFFIRSTKNSKTSLEQSVLKASSIAERKNLKRIFLTWDPQTHSLASITDKYKSIVGVGEMARGEFDPFVVVEITSKSP